MKTLDNRVHFALNCGAFSCPPILFYTAENLHNELEMATSSFLNSSEIEYKEKENKVYISKIFFWFKGDFGGKRGAIRLLKKYKVLPQNSNPYIAYKEYNWKILENKYLENK